MTLMQFWLQSLGFGVLSSELRVWICRAYQGVRVSGIQGVGFEASRFEASGFRGRLPEFRV